jgi:hypothetical protein
MVIDRSNDFAVRKLVNMSKRLTKEKGVEHQVLVSIEADENSTIGYSIYFIDKATNQRMKVNPERLYAYYYAKPISEYLPDFSQT